MSFTAQSDCIKEIERTLKINDKVLRYYHNRLDDRKDIAKHMEDFKDRLVESRKRYEKSVRLNSKPKMVKIVKTMRSCIRYSRDLTLLIKTKDALNNAFIFFVSGTLSGNDFCWGNAYDFKGLNWGPLGFGR